MEVKIKRLNDKAVMPRYATSGSAGFDLTATSVAPDAYGNIVYYTGLAFEIPEGYVGLLFMRSSVSNTELHLRTAVSVIDSDYRGEVTAKFRCDNDSMMPLDYNPGDRIVQMVIVQLPQVELEEVDELSETERGTGGYGSTGR